LTFVELFVDRLTSHLSYIAVYVRKQTKQRDQIVASILNFYEVLQRRKRWHLVKPLLQGLKPEGLPLTYHQAEVFISDLLVLASGTREDIHNPILKEELQILALQVVSQLSSLSVKVCPTTRRQWIIDCSQAVLESAVYREVQFSNKENIAASAAVCLHFIELIL
jgi:hypothetical protein